MLGFLFSYWYCKRLDLDKLFQPLDPQPPMIADSGAFTAWKKGVTIDVQQYAEWIERWKHWFPYYANLDVKGDWVAGIKNQQRLEEMGYHPIPVYHGGEPWHVLEQFVDEGHKYIALGGISGATMKPSNPQVIAWMEGCFERTGGKAGLHGFGMTEWKLVRRFPWRSVDSSSIGAGYRYGQVNIYDPYTKRWWKWEVKDRKSWGKHGWLVREYGLQPSDFANPRTRECTRALIRLGTRSMGRAIQDLPATQMYVVDDGGTQAGLRRVHAFNEANRAQVYLTDSSLEERIDPGAANETRLAIANEANS